MRVKDVNLLARKNTGNEDNNESGLSSSSGSESCLSEDGRSSLLDENDQRLSLNLQNASGMGTVQKAKHVKLVEPLREIVEYGSHLLGGGGIDTKSVSALESKRFSPRNPMNIQQYSSILLSS